MNGIEKNMAMPHAIKEVKRLEQSLRMRFGASSALLNAPTVTPAFI